MKAREAKRNTKQTYTQRQEDRYRDKQIERDIHRYKHAFFYKPISLASLSFLGLIIADSAQQGEAK